MTDATATAAQPLTKEQQLQKKGYGLAIFWMVWAILFFAAGISVLQENSEKYSETAGLISWFCAMGLCSIWPAVYAIKRFIHVNAFNKYLVPLRESAEGSLEYVAEKSGHTLDKVTKNLEYYLKKGWLKNSAIDYANNLLVFEYSITAPQNASKSVKSYSGNANLVSIICPGCGATNSVAHGVVAECEYCGAKIKG